MVKSEYEKIIYSDVNFIFSIFNGFFCPLHHHREIELCLLLEGQFSVTIHGTQLLLNPGDIWIINPWASHETRSIPSNVPILAVELQISPAFFSAYFPQMERTEFACQIINKTTIAPEIYEQISSLIMKTAQIYFQKSERYELKCAGQINLLFDKLMEALPYRILSEKELLTEIHRTAKIRKISSYISQNYTRKLLLSEIAADMGYSMSYLSHFFKECIGIPFQEYLMMLRCEKARQMLQTTKLPLLDISESCGFSDPKYFNKGFLMLYGYTPKEYRKNQSSSVADPAMSGIDKNMILLSYYNRD